MKKNRPNKVSLLLVFLIIFLSTCTSSTTLPKPNPSVKPSIAAAASPEVSKDVTPGSKIQETAEITPTVYLPLVNLPSHKFLGIYFETYWTDQTVESYLLPADQQSGNKLTSMGWFIDLQNIAFTPIQNDNGTNNFYRQLEALWNKGYISFVNLGSAKDQSSWDVPDNCPMWFSLNQLIAGDCDRAIEKMADLYYQWVSLGGGRRAMITPLQEMNGVWTSYGEDPNTAEEYKQAYRHIIDIFAARGITRDQVWWVFAPNGYNDPGVDARKFENYYPGDDVVDINSFSSYNWGYCPNVRPEWRTWSEYEEIFEPYINRMEAMAPTKLIMIAETATTPFYTQDENQNPISDYEYMNQWFIRNYEYLANRKSVIGIYYFSFQRFGDFDQCQMEVNPGQQMLSGFVTAASNPIFQKLNVATLNDILKIH